MASLCQSKHINPAILLVSLIFVLAGAATWVQAASVPGSFAQLVKDVSPSVVNIRTVKTVKTGPGPRMLPFGGPGGPQDPDDGEGPPDLHDFFRRFFGGPGGPQGDGHPREFKQRSLGSGVIVDAKGYVLTNNHVVAGADEIIVRLKNGEEYQAQIKGRDKKTDLALIKMETDKPMHALPLGSSKDLEVGDWVVAVGNPFGLENTVTAGIVSAKGRIIGAGPYDNFIQTDASINPGNSGGPLINLKGELVGINTAIVAQGKGIGFAIPVDLARQVMGQLREKGRVVRGWLGVGIQEVSKDLAEKLGLDKAEGVAVTKVFDGSPAAKAGLKAGDVITHYDSQAVHDPRELSRIVAGTKVGKAVEVKLVRQGKPQTLKVSVGEMEDQIAEVGGVEPQSKASLGMTVQPLTPELAEKLGLAGKNGLLISDVEPDGPAAEAGLRRGDVILEAGQKPVKSLQDFEGLTRKLGPGDGLLLLIQRRQASMFVVVKLPKK